MMKFSIFRIPKYKQFHYEPRYYNAVKEEIDARIATIKHDLTKEDAQGQTVYRSSISGAFRKGATQKAASISSVLKFLIIIQLLTAALAYFYFMVPWNYVLLGVVISLYLTYRLARFLNKPFT